MQKDRNSDAPTPSELSGNYSGTSAIYTPDGIVNAVLHGIDWILAEKFQRSGGIFNPDIWFFDPAAGMLAFPLGILRLAHQSLSLDRYLKWLDEFKTHLNCHEVDPEIAFKASTAFIQQCSSYLNSNNRPSLKIVTHANSLDETVMRSLYPTPLTGPLIIMGNPPYSISSITKSPWIQSLIEDYKPGLNRTGKKRIVGLKGIQDEYVKFIRMAQWVLVDNKRQGILAYVVNNYFLDGAIFRGLRQSLREAFDSIWIIDLHGDPKRPPKNNIADENVFNIRTGICLLFAICKGNGLHSPEFCQVNYAESRGTLVQKIDFLALPFEKLPFTEISPRDDWEMIPLSQEAAKIAREYNQFPYLAEIFISNIIGGQSLHDTLVTHPDRKRLEEIITRFYTGYYKSKEIKDQRAQTWVKTDGIIYHDARDWKIAEALQGNLEHALQHIIPWQWRGFDRWWVCYDALLMTKGSSSFRLMQFLLPQNRSNLAIGNARVSRKAPGGSSVFVTDTIAESHFIEGGSGIGDYIFPLFVNEKVSKKADWDAPLSGITPNFSLQFLKWLENSYTPQFKMSQLDDGGYMALFAYIYAVLWCPPYRDRYRFCIKSEFPRIPFPKQYGFIEKLSQIGRKLIDWHLLKSDSSDVIESINRWSMSKSTDLSIYGVHYNPDEHRIYFCDSRSDSRDQSTHSLFWVGDISPAIWDFEIGGIRQLELWLKNRQLSPRNTKFGFDRPLNQEELRFFLRICMGIKKTIEILPILTQEYHNAEIEGWLAFYIIN